MAKKRHNNQVRVIAPEADKRMAAVAAALVRAGLPDAYADTLAEGFVARLRRVAWVNLTDAIGNGDDLEALLGWKGPARTLAAALAAGRYVRDINGVYVACDAVTECPEYIKARWKRHSFAGYEAARARAATPNVVHARADDPKQDNTVAAAGVIAPDPAGENASVAPESTQPGHQEAVEDWHAQYLGQYGTKYPWRPRDFKTVADLLRLAGDIFTLKRAFQSFLRCREDFYAGHELRWLYRDFARFNRGQSRSKPVGSVDPIDDITGAL